MTGSTHILENNLVALGVSSPRLAGLIRQTAARADVEFAMTDEGVLSATAGGRAVCSRRRPLEEARRLVETVDVAAAAGVVVQGFGLGHHVRAMLERLNRTGVVFVFEPDLGLLRAVLERVDHSGWLVSRNVVFLTDAEDTGAISEATRGCEGLLAMGVKFLEHPADRARLGEKAVRFAANFAGVYRAVRTTVVTTLMQSEVTLRNLLMNVDRYATCAGVKDLEGAAKGRPAIVVSAGPSLKRNIDLLARPGVRDRFVIIAVQTVLKQLLARGIKPHFVTALDHHEISRRFYEGLSAADVEGVTLIAEPKVNPAVLEVFPGRVRMPADWLPGSNCPSLDDLLGEGLRREMGMLPAGATVAHLAYYVARFMGCDPVILVGQDLGFTDGQYYSAGAAIHQVWSGELNSFRTLEMMEWERIVRGRSHLHRATDHLGRFIYTDEQMATYRVQFERDFKADGERGLRVIDATEGGVAKQGAEVMTLAAALEKHGTGEMLRLPEAAAERDGRLPRVGARVREVRQEVWRIEDLSRRGRALLEQMLAHHEDQSRVNILIGKVQEIGKEAMATQPAFGLVQRLNQTGTLKRAKADRMMAVDAGLPAIQMQRRQIERDVMNLSWTQEAAAKVGGLLEDVLRCLDGAPKITRDVEEVEESAGGSEPAGPVRVVALVPVDFERGGLGTVRDLGAALWGGLNPLQMTLRRLGRCTGIEGVVVLSGDVERARRLVGPMGPGMKVEFAATDGAPLGERAGAVAAGRLWARACWRGGLGGLTVYDEVCAPPAMSRLMEERGIDGAVLVGPDWAAVDPALVDEVVARYRQRPRGEGAHRLTFCQAPPGLGACVVERSLMKELAERGRAAGVFASIGGLLGYVPIAPLADPIVKPVCVAAPAGVRDAQTRFIADSDAGRAVLGRVVESLGVEGAMEAGAAAVCAAVGRLGVPAGPQELVLELCTGRRAGLTAGRGAEAPERQVMTLAAADRIVHELAVLRRDAVLTLAGAGDPMLHPEALSIVAMAKGSGVAGVHVRTDLLCEPERVEALFASGADVISVDVCAETAETYRAVMGSDRFDRVRGNLQRLLELRAAREAVGGLPKPWIVPRMTRCDATYGEIEGFYDRWIMLAGAAVIDPLSGPMAGERIEPLPVPALAARRMARERMLVLSDGRAPASDSDVSGERIAADVFREGLGAAWRKVAMRGEQVEGKPEMLHGAGSRARVARLGVM